MLQALVTRELEEAAKTLGDRVRQKDATCEVSGWMSSTVMLLLMHALSSALTVALATVWLAARKPCVAATAGECRTNRILTVLFCMELLANIENRL